VGLARIGTEVRAADAGRRISLRASLRALAIGAALLTLSIHSPAFGAFASVKLEVVADRDDDDADGTPDSEEAFLPPAGRVDLVVLPPSLTGASIHPMGGAEHVRVLAAGRPVPWGTPLPVGAAVQGIGPGRMSGVIVRGGEQAPIEIGVSGIAFRDGAGKSVDAARSHASIERTPPERTEGGWDAHYDDGDALRLVLEEEEGYDPSGIVSVESVSARGIRLDQLLHPALGPSHCDAALSGLRCEASLPLRFVIDDVDRRHALVRDRSLRVELGGAVVVRKDGKKLQAIRVEGPRNSPIGPIGRLRATLRPIVVRVAPGGAPAIGGSEAGAVAALRAELALASAVWGQCGVTFGDPESEDVRIIDPPPPHLLAIGDDLGLPAEGGEIRLRIDVKKTIVVRTQRGASPTAVALDVSLAVTQAGYVAVLSPNARIGPGANGSVDISVRRPDGSLVALEPGLPGPLLSTDPSLSVRIGAVDLSDGLQHFGDMDSSAGTLEERTLLKAVDDGDPRTIEIFVVPFFGGGGRIGESFIGSDLSSVRNVVLLDRAGIRARRSSLTLAHELGHVLLDLPGHPDDYGVDTPTWLMDSDASDASPFGPRRLAVEECARMMRESGPAGRAPLLADWPLKPVVYAAVSR
jgi:hypothetical protein